MLKRLNLWIKKKTGFLAMSEKIIQLESDVERLQFSAKRMESIIKEHVTWSADVSANHRHGPSTVVLVGRYRKKDYVNVYNIEDDQFSDLVNHLREIDRNFRRGPVDSHFGIKRFIDI